VARAGLKLGPRKADMTSMRTGLFLLLPFVLALSACEQLGIDDPAKIAAAKEAEGKAIGGACRHASRAIEDCYTLNPKAQKAAVYQGWKEMDEYMRENKLDGIVPVVPRPSPVKPNPNADEEADKPAEKGSENGGNKASDKAAEKGSEKSKPAKTSH